MSSADSNRSVSATWLAGTSLTALSIPLVLFGAQPLDVSLGDYNLRGTLGDYAMPYLGVAMAASLGLGIRRLLQEEDGLGNGTQFPTAVSTASALVPTPSHPQTSWLSEERLRLSGLSYFLEADEAVSSELPQPSPCPTERAVAAAPPAILEAALVPAPPVEPTPASQVVAGVVAEVQSLSQHIQGIHPSATSPTATAASSPSPGSGHSQRWSGSPTTLPAAQSYVSFARPRQAVAQRFQAQPRDLTAELAALEQVHQIREQILMIMNQVDMIQASLEQTLYPAQRPVTLRPVAAPSYVVGTVEPMGSAAMASSASWYGQSAIAS